MEAFNKKSGLEKDIKAGEHELRCNGFADDFMAPASLFQMGTDSNETYTFFFGKVSSVREVESALSPFSFAKECKTTLAKLSKNQYAGRYGNGWKGVWRWCKETESIRMLIQEVQPGIDAVVIRMDGDVLRKEKEDHCLCETRLRCIY